MLLLDGGIGVVEGDGFCILAIPNKSEPEISFFLEPLVVETDQGLTQIRGYQGPNAGVKDDREEQPGEYLEEDGGEGQQVDDRGEHCDEEVERGARESSATKMVQDMVPQQPMQIEYLMSSAMRWSGLSMFFSVSIT